MVFDKDQLNFIKKKLTYFHSHLEAGYFIKNCLSLHQEESSFLLLISKRWRKHKAYNSL